MSIRLKLRRQRTSRWRISYGITYHDIVDLRSMRFGLSKTKVVSHWRELLARPKHGLLFINLAVLYRMPPMNEWLWLGPKSYKLDKKCIYNPICITANKEGASNVETRAQSKTRIQQITPAVSQILPIRACTIGIWINAFAIRWKLHQSIPWTTM